jgi:hypothetical protein
MKGILNIYWTGSTEMIVITGEDSVVWNGVWWWWNEFFEFMGENVPPRLVALQRSTQYFKEVIKECIIGGTYISYLGIDVWMLI